MYRPRAGETGEERRVTQEVGGQARPLCFQSDGFLQESAQRRLATLPVSHDLS